MDTLVRKSPKKRCLQEHFGQKENSEPESEPSYLSSSLVNQNNNRTGKTCEDCAYFFVRSCRKVEYENV